MPSVTQSYRELLDHVVSSGGLSEAAILDVRGNHDVYDVPERCAVSSASALHFKAMHWV